jgi:hypothetical protein
VAIKTGNTGLDSTIAQLTAEIVRAIEEKAVLAGEYASFKADTEAKVAEFNKQLEALKPPAV